MGRNSHRHHGNSHQEPMSKRQHQREDSYYKGKITKKLPNRPGHSFLTSYGHPGSQTINGTKQRSLGLCNLPQVTPQDSKHRKWQGQQHWVPVNRVTLFWGRCPLPYIQRSHISPQSHIKKTNNKCWPGWGEGSLIHCQWECKLVQTLWKSVGRSSET
jgi:hypothetical protein